MQKKSHATVIFGGGLDLVTPPQQVDPGRLLEVKNYECDLNGGYRQVSGFERLDGRSSPVDSDWYAIGTGTPSGVMTLGETVSQAVSGATGILIVIGTTGIYVVTVTGTFDATNIITGGTSGETATPTTAALKNITLSDAEPKNTVRFAKEIHFRDLIGAVPGTGDVRGVFKHEAVTLAVRDFDVSSARMYRASTSGWTQITASWIMFFTSGVLASQPIPGTSLEDGVGNAVVVQRVVSTTISGTDGYMVVTGFTSGFAAGANIEDGATLVAVVAVSGEPSQVVLQPGGKNEWRSHTFTGAVDAYKVYTADGVNPCMEYDPIADIILPIYTDQAFRSIDTPSFVAIYRNHLFVGYERGIIRNSEPGNQFLWDASQGSLETFVGSAITGFDEVPKALIVVTRRATYALTGQVAENFTLDIASASAGGQAYTAQSIGTTYMLDDRGIIELSRVQAFGNFENATVSRLIQPFLLSIRGSIIASTVNLSNNIYRLVTSDGRGVTLTFQEGQIVGFGVFELEVTINVISNAEDELGNERVLFGGADGFVYELEKGVSFDGNAKEAWFKTVYQPLQSTTIRKRFFRAFFDAVVEGTSSVSISAEYSYGSADVRATDAVVDTAVGFKSAWDIGKWDEMIWDSGSSAGSAYVDLTGTGDSISLIVYSKSATDDIIIFKDVIYEFKTRRGLRGRR